MKSLYEAVNGYIGCSYVRCYVWADSEAEARQLADAAFAKRAEGRPNESGSMTKEIRKLFDADSEAFATVPCDEGWREDE